MIKIRFIVGERELQFLLLSCVISPTRNQWFDGNHMMFRFREGRTRVQHNYSSPVNLPDWKLVQKKTETTQKSTEGRTRVKINYSSPVNLPDNETQTHSQITKTKNQNEGRTTTHNYTSPLCHYIKALLHYTGNKQKCHFTSISPKCAQHENTKITKMHKTKKVKMQNCVTFCH